MKWSTNSIQARLKDLESKNKVDLPDIFLIQPLIDGDIILISQPDIIFKNRKDFDHYCEYYETHVNHISTIISSDIAAFECRNEPLNKLLEASVYSNGQIRPMTKKEQAYRKQQYELGQSQRDNYIATDRQERKDFFQGVNKRLGSIY